MMIDSMTSTEKIDLHTRDEQKKNENVTDFTGENCDETKLKITEKGFKFKLNVFM